MDGEAAAPAVRSIGPVSAGDVRGTSPVSAGQPTETSVTGRTGATDSPVAAGPVPDSPVAARPGVPARADGTGGTEDAGGTGEIADQEPDGVQIAGSSAIRLWGCVLCGCGPGRCGPGGGSAGHEGSGGADQLWSLPQAGSLDGQEGSAAGHSPAGGATDGDHSAWSDPLVPEPLRPDAVWADQSFCPGHWSAGRVL